MKALRVLLIAVFLITCGCATIFGDGSDDPAYRIYISAGREWLAQNPGKTWADFNAVWEQAGVAMYRDPNFLNWMTQQQMLREMQFQNQLLMIGPRPLQPYAPGIR